jgi:UDP-N-acetylmuramate: L-alanyl-gamma-D-glutamyl-meso-diaminopimelate ligase
MGPALERWGIRCLRGFDPAHLSPAPDLVVIGNVCRPDNVEARAAIDGGLEYTHLAGALDRFVLTRCRPLVVAGTHGKTTTTALAAWLLDATGRAPGFLIGGIPKNFDRGFRAPRGRLPVAGTRTGEPTPFALEGDEYDTAFFEKTAKFLHYRAQVAVVTGIEHDHIDIYPTERSYFDAFRRFVALVPPEGLIVANAADRATVEIVGAHARAEIAWFALSDEDTHGVAPHWLAARASTDSAATSFDLYAGGVACGRWATRLIGDHNLRNTVAAIGAVAQGFGVPLGQIGPALARFEGVRRRQDLLGSPRGVAVYDDFAHHPTAVRETLIGLRARHPDGRLFAVFEPRSATACRAIHQADYPAAFDAADVVLLAPLGRANLAPEERLDTEQVASDLQARGKVATRFENVDAIIDALAADARQGDTIVLLSNGAFGGIHDRLVIALERSRHA